METYYWDPSNARDTSFVQKIWHEKVEVTATFVAFHIAIDPASGHPNGLRGDPMVAFDPAAGGLILMPIGKA